MNQPRRFVLWSILAMLCMPLSTAVQAEPVACRPMAFTVIMATPFSSRIDRVGDSLQAVLEHAVNLSETRTLPAGTLLKGKVSGIRESDAGEAGQIQIRFTQATGPTLEAPIPLDAVPNTPDGWLRQGDADTPVWHVSLGRSTRLLNMMIQRRLGTNRAVWAQKLDVRENVIPDPSTDAFIQKYNRHDVLVGAGDRLQLRLDCNPPR